MLHSTGYSGLVTANKEDVPTNIGQAMYGDSLTVVSDLRSGCPGPVKPLLIIWQAVSWIWGCVPLPF